MDLISNIAKYVLTLLLVIVDKPIVIVVHNKESGSTLGTGHGLLLAVMNGLTQIFQGAGDRFHIASLIDGTTFPPSADWLPGHVYAYNRLPSTLLDLPKSMFKVNIYMSRIPSWIISIGSFLRRTFGLGVSSTTFVANIQSLKDSGLN